MPSTKSMKPEDSLFPIIAIWWPLKTPPINSYYHWGLRHRYHGSLFPPISKSLPQPRCLISGWPTIIWAFGIFSLGCQIDNDSLIYNSWSTSLVCLTQQWYAWCHQPAMNPQVLEFNLVSHQPHLSWLGLPTSHQPWRWFIDDVKSNK